MTDEIQGEDKPPEEELPPLLVEDSAPTDLDPEDGDVQPEIPPEKTSGLHDLWQKQPFYLKSIASLIGLALLIWMLIPKCSAPPMQEKTFLIAYDRTWTPLNLISEQLNMSAFIESLVDTIAKNQKLRVHVVSTSSPLFNLTEKGDCDGVISIINPPQPIEHKYIYSSPLYHLGFVMVVRNDEIRKNIKDFSGRRVGIVSYIDVLRRITDIPSVIFSNFDNAPQALASLDNHYIDGVILDNLEASYMLEGLYAGKYRILAEAVTNEGIELYMLKNEQTEKFIASFNEGLLMLRTSGEYKQMIIHWDLTNTSIE
jgi:ABC-type amino acid transport substrate-binding protein